MRYQFYREHKYVSAALNDVERLIAKTDFTDVASVASVAQQFDGLAQMLQAHAQYENAAIHELLRKKNSTLHTQIESEHILQDESLAEIQALIAGIGDTVTEEEKIRRGYALYLTYRKFVADNLLHLHEEETQILPELQRLYTDAELRQVAAPAYREMMPEQIVQMLTGLFPHMNLADKKAFLVNIQALEPLKLSAVWAGIAPLLSAQERDNLSRQIPVLDPAVS